MASFPITAKKRESNLELFRIIAMLSIVAHHYVVNSGVLEQMEVDTINAKSVFYWLFGMWGKTGINCFVLITGWFMCRSQITLRKFLKLYLEIIFYCLLFYIIFIITGYIKFSLKDFFFSVFPIHGMNNSFVSSFLVFYLFIPFLNILVHNMSFRQHSLLLLLCVFGYTFMGSIPWFHVSFNYVSWFSVLFLIASYFRLYCENLLVFKNLKWGWWSILFVLISSCSVIVILLTGKKQELMPYYFVSDSNKVLALTTSLCLFMFFKNLTLSYHKWINVVASTTFGVFLIHTNSVAMRQWLWQDVVDVKGHYMSDSFLWYSICVVFVIFIICMIMDLVRIRFFEQPIVRFLEHYI